MVKAKLTVKVRTPQGKLVCKRTYKAHSFLRNFLRLLGGLIASHIMVSNWALLNTAGVSKDAGAANDDQANLATGNIYIYIGNGTTAPTITDYKIESQLKVAAVAASQEVEDDPNYSVKWAVAIQNTTGSPWAVTEYVLACNVVWANSTIIAVLLRDVPGNTVNVADGEFIEVEYELITTV